MLPRAAMFVSAGYDTLQSINDMQELGRAFFLHGIRKDRKAQPNFPELRLIADLFETYGTSSTPKCAPGNPRIAELTIPKEMETLRLDLSCLSGLLAPGREMVNFPTLEMPKTKQKRPAYHPYVIPDLSKEPWRPFYPAHTKAMESWRPLNGSRKKPSPMDLSFQSFVFYNLRFSLSGDLAGCWAPFGGISAQMTHFGLILNMAVVENATIAMTYDKQFMEQASHLARQRTTTVDWAHFLSGEDDVIKRNVLRVLGHASATMKAVTKKPTNPDQPSKGPDRAGKRDPKGKKKGKKGGKQDWNSDWRGKQNNWARADWGNFRATQQKPQNVTPTADPATVVPKRGVGK